jgi:hypothetical protein
VLPPFPTTDKPEGFPNPFGEVSGSFASPRDRSPSVVLSFSSGFLLSEMIMGEELTSSTGLSLFPLLLISINLSPRSWAGVGSLLYYLNLTNLVKPPFCRN